MTDVKYKQCVIAAGEGAKAALSAYDYLKNTNNIVCDALRGAAARTNFKKIMSTNDVVSCFEPYLFLLKKAGMTSQESLSSVFLSPWSLLTVLFGFSLKS